MLQEGVEHVFWRNEAFLETFPNSSFGDLLG